MIIIIIQHDAASLIYKNHLIYREMEKADNNIEKKVEETLSSADHIEKASPGPFFYTRLKGRLENKQSIMFPGKVFISPVLQRVLVAMVVLIFAANIYTFSRLFSGAMDNASSTDEQALMEEYYPSVPTLYNLTDLQTP